MAENTNTKKIIFINDEAETLRNNSDLLEKLWVSQSANEDKIELNLSNQILYKNILGKEQPVKKWFKIYCSEIEWMHSQALWIVLTDITSIQELSAQKDRLLRSVSHDMRTPLNGILGMMEAAINSDDIDFIKGKLNIGINTANGLQILINDLLDFAQISNEKLKFTQKYSTLNEIFKEIFEIFNFQTAKKNIQLLFNFTNCDGIEKFPVDENRLKQILFNLIGNAIKFTNKGHIRIAVSIVESENVKQQKFEIQDTGIGVKQEDIPKLFKLFGKLKQDDANINKQGVGLGLYNCQNLLSLQNPKLKEKPIDVKSEQNVGSVFTFYICKDFEASTIQIENYSHDPSIMSTKKRFSMDSSLSQSKLATTKWIKKINKEIRILIVDDDQICLDVISNQLSGVNVITALGDNGKNAIKIIQENAEKNEYFDVIILDCQMPIMDGQEASMIIKKMEEEKQIKKVKIIALTGNVSTVDIENCHDHKMDKTLAKPVRKVELFKALNEVLGIEAFELI